MENTSLPSDVWDDVTTSSSEADGVAPNLLYTRDLALKVIYIIIGIVGVLDNLFVIVIFIFFIKIADKVAYFIIIIINVKINVALSENASRTRYTIKIKLKLGKWVLEQKSFQLSFERREWAGRSDNGWKTISMLRLL